MEVHRLRILAQEAFRSINNIKPGYIQNLFDKNKRLIRRPVTL